MTDTGVQFGTAYYPEQWDRKFWENDARRMKEMGLTVVRLMEFAWAILEPRKGRYDFSLFDEAISIFTRHGIKIVLGTPTATPPVWLYKKDPGIRQIFPDGTIRDFGARRECCFNSPTYFSASMSIVCEIARHYSKSPDIIGWQIDNEIGHEGSDQCVCGNCVKAWHIWLQKKYRTITELNRTWGTVFWSTTYSSFDEVPAPRIQVATSHNPGLLLDYARFMSDSAVQFAHAQTAIIRKHARSGAWITHNLFFPAITNLIDMEKLHAPMDLVSYDNYPVWGDMNEPLPYMFVSECLSHARGLKRNEKFTIMEQFSNFQGHRCLGYLPPEKQVVLWTNHAIAHGADRIFYFSWRTPPFGQEQLCHGILNPDNETTERYHILAHNIKDHQKDFTRIAASRFEPQACLMYDKDSIRILHDQYLSKALYLSPAKWIQAGPEVELLKYYSPFVLFGVNADIKTPSSIDLDSYRVISLPLYQMADPVFVGKLSAWVQSGGRLILGWHAGSRTMDNHASPSPLPGLFSDMAGIKIRKFESLNETTVGIRAGIFPSKGGTVAEIIEPSTAKVIARYSDRKKFYNGSPAVTVNNHGKGKVYYFGTTPGPLGLFILYRKILKDAGLNPGFMGYGIETIHRISADGKKFRVILNHSPRTRLIGLRKIDPYGMKILG